jgi:hypothetical protein
VVTPLPSQHPLHHQRQRDAAEGHVDLWCDEAGPKRPRGAVCTPLRTPQPACGGRWRKAVGRRQTAERARQTSGGPATEPSFLKDYDVHRITRGGGNASCRVRLYACLMDLIIRRSRGSEPPAGPRVTHAHL